MNSGDDVKNFCAAVLFVIGCSGEPQATTNTIAPAEGRPAPPLATTAIDHRPALATAGSPRPASAAAPGTTYVTVGSGGIDVQRLLPRAHTVFHVDNKTATAHEIVVRGGTGSATASLPPNGKSTLQLLLGTGPYDIACTAPGHQESARFETYAAGVPLNTSEKAPASR